MARFPPFLSHSLSLGNSFHILFKANVTCHVESNSVNRETKTRWLVKVEMR